jgi:hypothetical protein
MKKTKQMKQIFKERWLSIANVEMPFPQEYYYCARCANCCKIIYIPMSKVWKCRKKRLPILCKECGNGKD